MSFVPLAYLTMRLNGAVLQIRLKILPFPLEVMHNPFSLAHFIQLGTKSLSHCAVLIAAIVARQ